MNKHILFLLEIQICLSILLYCDAVAQEDNDLKVIIQKCLDFKVLEEHLKKNEKIIHWNSQAKILVNEWVNINLNLYKGGKPVIFVQDGFDSLVKSGGYNYNFTKLTIKKKQAKVNFGYFPWFIYKKGLPIHSSRGRTHFVIELNFIKNVNNEWIIGNFTIKDPVFNVAIEIEQYLQENYIPYNL